MTFNIMKYKGNNKETKEAILKDNQAYLYKNLKQYTKLDLLGIIENRTERIDERHCNDEHYGSAVIVITLDGEQVQRLEIKENDYHISISNIFKLFNSLKHMYVDLGTVNASLTFIETYDSD